MYSYTHIFNTDAVIYKINPCLTDSKSLTADFLRTKLQKEVTKGI